MIEASSLQPPLQYLCLLGKAPKFQEICVAGAGSHGNGWFTVSKLLFTHASVAPLHIGAAVRPSGSDSHSAEALQQYPNLVCLPLPPSPCVPHKLDTNMRDVASRCCTSYVKDIKSWSKASPEQISAHRGGESVDHRRLSCHPFHVCHACCACGDPCGWF